jgi:hypothetical protein
MAYCYKCDEEIRFDEQVRSANGKHIPLDIYDNPHRCEDIDPISGYDNSIKRRCYKCGRDIFFDQNVVSRSGKCIPLEWETGDRHQCY